MKFFNELLIGLLVLGMVGCAADGPANLPPPTGFGAGEASVLIDAYKMDVGDNVKSAVAGAVTRRSTSRFARMAWWLFRWLEISWQRVLGQKNWRQT